MDGGVDRTARLAFFTTRFRAFRRTHFLCVENYIRKVLFHVFSQILGVEPGRDVTTRDGLLLNADRPHRHGRLLSLDMPG